MLDVFLPLVVWCGGVGADDGAYGAVDIAWPSAARVHKEVARARARLSAPDDPGTRRYRDIDVSIPSSFLLPPLILWFRANSGILHTLVTTTTASKNQHSFSAASSRTQPRMWAVPSSSV